MKMQQYHNITEPLLQRNQNVEITKKKQIQQDQQKYFKEEHYLSTTNIFKALLFTWISPLLKYGYHYDLQEKAIPKLRQKHKPQRDFIRLSTTFNESKSTLGNSHINGWMLTRSIFKAFRKQICLIVILAMLKSGLQMVMPILSHIIMTYIESNDRSTKMSIIYFIAIFIVTLSMSFGSSFLIYHFGVLGYTLSNTLSLLIYQKALKHPLITQKQFKVSDIINYSQVDAQRMTNMGFQLVSLLFTPIQIFVGLYLLYLYIGSSFLIALGVMITLTLLTLKIMKIATKANDKLLQAKDLRMKLTEQILQIIKFIKVNALEKYFFQKLNDKRDNQLKLIKKVNLSYVITIFIYWLCPTLIVSATFLLFVYQGNLITSPKAFLTIIIFNILQYPMQLLPLSITQLIQMWSSIKRIQKFLLAEQINQKFILYQQQKDNHHVYDIEIQHGYFLWGKQQNDKDNDNDKKIKKNKNKEKNHTHDSHNIHNDINNFLNTDNNINESFTSNSKQLSQQDTNQDLHQSDTQQSKTDPSIISLQPQPQLPTPPSQPHYIKALKQINIKIPSKKITMIIGQIGSSKSSLLYAILNQMTPQPTRNPNITVNGTIAYAPQKPWIMTGTVKQNIVFFNHYNQQHLNNVIHYSCLETDIKLFTNGIDTQIGQKGVNLSGGQKARISLARTLYSNKDIYFLDDVLSAVDVHVGKFIMQQTIMIYLKNKTILMPTHAIKYIEHADNVIIMKKGRIVAHGPLQQIRQCNQFKQIQQIQQKKQIQSQQNQQHSIKQQAQIKSQQRNIKQITRSFTQGINNQDNNDQHIENLQKIIQQLIMPQDRKTGKIGNQVYIQYIKYNGGLIFVFTILLCLSIWATLTTLSNIEIQFWCDDLAKNTKYVYLFLIFSISGAIFSGTRAYILVISNLRQGRQVHRQIIKALLYASITKFYNRVPLGRILNRLSKDLRDIDQALGFSVGDVLISAFCLIRTLTLCIYGSPIWLLAPIAISGLACIKLKDYYLKSQRQCVRLQNISNSPIVSGFTSAVNGVATIRAFKLQRQFFQHQMSKIETNKQIRIARTAMESWFALRLSFLSLVINMSALGFCILSGNQSASIAGLLLAYSTMFSDNFIWLAFSYSILQLKMISLERISAFIKIQPQPGYMKYCSEWQTNEEGSNLQAISQGKIEFRNYCARYRDGLPLVMKNITITINPGNKVGIVGRTGAGKSTLISCLVRILQPASGQIYIDDKNIMEYEIKDLRSCITMIEQQPTLMNGTFRDNLDPTNCYTDVEILNVLNQCHLLEMVESKGGLLAAVSNENLSVGEKQLLCICRAFLKKSKIILVDEATANIDVKRDQLIQQVIAEKFKTSTVLTIAHRLSTLKDCDNILVLGAGKVLEWGSTVELMGTDSIYRKMCESNDKTYFA